MMGVLRKETLYNDLYFTSTLSDRDYLDNKFLFLNFK